MRRNFRARWVVSLLAVLVLTAAAWLATALNKTS